jgi:type IV/VI secretion system ImpK/VasF family protein
MTPDIETLETVFQEYLDFILLGGRLRSGEELDIEPEEFQELLLDALAEARLNCQDVLEPGILDQVEYTVVGFLDESALGCGNTVQEYWRGQTLESVLYESDVAGEVFIDRVDEALQATRPPLATLLIFFLCLLNGFEGELAGEEHGDKSVARRIREIHAILNRATDGLLFAGPAHMQVSSTVKQERLPLWVLPVLGVCVLLVAFGIMWKSSGTQVESFLLELSSSMSGLNIR